MTINYFLQSSEICDTKLSFINLVFNKEKVEKSLKKTTLQNLNIRSFSNYVHGHLIKSFKLNPEINVTDEDLKILKLFKDENRSTNLKNHSNKLNLLNKRPNFSSNNKNMLSNPESKIYI